MADPLDPVIRALRSCLSGGPRVSPLREIADSRRHLPPPDTAHVLARLAGERYEWMPRRHAARARRAHARAILGLVPAAAVEIRAELRRRAASGAITIEEAMLDAAAGYWRLARVAGAGVAKIAGFTVETNAARDLRRWMNVVPISRG